MQLPFESGELQKSEGSARSSATPCTRRQSVTTSRISGLRSRLSIRSYSSYESRICDSQAASAHATLRSESRCSRSLHEIRALTGLSDVLYAFWPGSREQRLEGSCAAAAHGRRHRVYAILPVDRQQSRSCRFRLCFVNALPQPFRRCDPERHTGFSAASIPESIAVGSDPSPAGGDIWSPPRRRRPVAPTPEQRARRARDRPARDLPDRRDTDDGRSCVQLLSAGCDPTEER